MCATSPMTGAPSHPAEAGSVALTYPFSSIITSARPIARSSSARYLPSTFCFSVLGQVTEYLSDIVGNETYFKNLSVISISVFSRYDLRRRKQGLSALSEHRLKACPAAGVA